MKIKVYFSILFTIALFAFAQAEAAAQGKKTIVLVRHTEKVASTPTDKGDPELSAEGHERAIRLMNAVKKYKPHEIFATDYKRTRQTAEPIAAYRKKLIQTYDAAKPAELIDKIMLSKTEHYLMVGHSNTIPALANLLTKKEIFRPLLEAEFGVIWVIRMKKGVLTKVEIFTY